MPHIQCLLTSRDRLLMVQEPSGRLSALTTTVQKGESPLEACSREVRRLLGFHISPSCAGIVYAAEDSEHDYTLIFVADAPADGAADLPAPLCWVGLHGIKDLDGVGALQRELVPLVLTADGPLVVVLDSTGTEPVLKHSAPIPHARLSPLVFAVAP